VRTRLSFVGGEKGRGGRGVEHLLQREEKKRKTKLFRKRKSEEEPSLCVGPAKGKEKRRGSVRPIG